MTRFLVDEDFVREHREMFRWFRSQQQAESLSERGQRVRKDAGLVPVIFVEALDGEKTLAQARRLVVRQPKYPAQIVSIPQTVTSGSFTLTGNGNTTTGINYDASVAGFQAQMDTLYGPGNTTVTGAPGVWIVRRDAAESFDLMTSDESGLGGIQKVSIVKTGFNSVSPDKLKVFQVMPNHMGETLPIGTIAWTTPVPGLGYCIVRHNKERPTFVAKGTADANIAAAASGTVSLFRGTTDTAENLTCLNITDQQADSGKDVLIVELVNEDGDLYYACLPVECPA